jgi:hypothetical protein
MTSRLQIQISENLKLRGAETLLLNMRVKLESSKAGKDQAGMSVFVALLLSVMLACANAQGSLCAGQRRAEEGVRPCPSIEPQTSSQGKWQEVDAEGLFTFCLPSDMRRHGVSGVESLYRYYSNGRLSFYFVHEPYSYLSYDSRTSEGKNYQEEAIKIGDRQAVLFTYEQEDEGRKSFHAELYVGNWAEGQVELIMSGASSDPADIKIVKKILTSLRFNDSPRNPKK